MSTSAYVAGMEVRVGETRQPPRHDVVVEQVTQLTLLGSGHGANGKNPRNWLGCPDRNRRENGPRVHLACTTACEKMPWQSGQR